MQFYHTSHLRTHRRDLVPYTHCQGRHLLRTGPQISRFGTLHESWDWDWDRAVESLRSVAGIHDAYSKTKPWGSVDDAITSLHNSHLVAVFTYEIIGISHIPTARVIQLCK